MNTLTWQPLKNGILNANSLDGYSYKISTIKNNLYKMQEYYYQKKTKEYAVVDDLEYTILLAEILSAS